MDYATQHKARVAQLATQHGGIYRIPSDELMHLNEILRARAIVDANPDESPKRLMQRYGVTTRAATEVLGDSPDEFVPVRKSKRADKYAAIYAWCDQNAGAVTTVYEIAEIGQVSYSTANNLIKDRVDLFHKVKKGEYIVRNPKAERAAEK